MYMARTFMVHSSLHWAEYNRLPYSDSGLTPMELLTRSKANHRDILRCHVWGCPVFVLDPKLQNDQKLPKWNRRARMGQFLGFLDEHSSLVANVRNLSTGYISPQFHLVFDDLFETVVCLGEDDIVFDTICNGLFDLERDWYAED